MKNLLILGAGQYGQVAREIAEAMGLFEHISFLDDNSSAAIGKLSDFYKCTNGIPYYINTLANQLPTDTLLTKEDIVEYYVENNHTIKECADFFKISWNKASRLIKKYQIEKTPEEILNTKNQY